MGWVAYIESSLSSSGSALSVNIMEGKSNNSCHSIRYNG